MAKILACVSIFAVIGLNILAGGFKEDRFFQDLPKAFASAEKGAVIGGTRDLLLIACGMRALASDFAMLDMLLYYGTHQHEDEEEESGHEQPVLPGSVNNQYLDLYAMTNRIIALDPYFRYAVLFGGGALAFNEGRLEQAIDILEEGRRRDPKHWQYSLVLSSIAYKKVGDYGKIIESLEGVVDSPDCPDMLRNILANYYLKVGNIPKAVQILRKMAAESTDKGYRESARQKLTRLGVQP